MRLFDAEPQIIRDIKKEHPAFKLFAARHPTIGKVVIVESKDGDGIIAETDG